MLPSIKQARIGIVAAVALTLPLAACGGSDNSGSNKAKGSSSSGSSKKSSLFSGVQKDSKAAAMVPDKIKSSGKVSVATDPSYAPMEFSAKNGNTIVGVDPDMGKALGKVLGLKFKFTKSTFDGIIPGLSSGKYDLGMSSFTDTKKREKKVQFVTYFKAGTILLVPEGNPKKLSTDDSSLCGKRVGAEKGTIQSDNDIPKRSKKCTAAGKKKIDEKVYPDQNAVNLALTTDRIDASLADSGVAGYMADKSHGKFETQGKPYASQPYGVAVPKNSGDFAKAIQKAVQSLIDDGTYKKILTKWHAGQNAISKSQIDVATS